MKRVVAHGRRLLASLAGLLALGTVAGAGEPVANWGVYDAAPFMITEPPSQDHGIFDEIRRLLDERLAGEAGQTMRAPFPRILASIKAGEPWCFVGGVKTPEREAFAAFSRPVAMFYPTRVIVRESERATFEALGPLSLRDLLARRAELRTSVLRNRSLGPEIDAVLRDFPDLPSHSSFTEAFRMLLSGRLDYLVDYANIATYNAERLEARGAFARLPLAEESEPVFARVMCPRTPWGLARIARIDAILKDERPTEAYRRLVESWSAPEDAARIRAVYDGAFLSGD